MFFKRNNYSSLTIWLLCHQLIKQSQDDGAEEITWRISPVNERLHAMSKHFPEMVKVLAESSRFNCSNFKQCSQRKVMGSICLLSSVYFCF